MNMKENIKQDYKTLFEQQSYEDALHFYTELLQKSGVTWDYVILTASNEDQAEGYRAQIAYRMQLKQLSKSTHFAVLSDPDGKRVGSGGATLNAVLYVKSQEEKKGNADAFNNRILVIHSGGDSKRVPQYSVCGKLFSPVPRELWNGRRSTLFDEFMIGMSTVAPRINSGMLVCSGDVLLLFNALQIEFYSKGAAALSIKEKVETGKNHGVYLSDSEGNVGSFLHKQSEEKLYATGAVDSSGDVDIDTGAVIMDSNMLADLCQLVAANPDKYINETVRLSFYADFLYPLASNATLEGFYLEKPEGEFSESLHECRTALWRVLSPYGMKLIRLSPASFIHFGTTRELQKLMTEEMDKYRFLGWKRSVGSNIEPMDYAVSNSYISRQAVIGEGSYIEDSYIHGNSVVGKNCVLSGVTLHGEIIPDNTVLHGLKLRDGRFVARKYEVNDNPKENNLWTRKIYPVCDTIEEAVKQALKNQECDKEEKMSLYDSFCFADVTAILPWQMKISDRVKAEQVVQSIRDGVPVEQLEIKISQRVCKYLLQEAKKMKGDGLEGFSCCIRIYHYLYKLTGEQKYSDCCFEIISQTVLQCSGNGVRYRDDLTFAREEVVTQLPVRVNWGGGWSDTPPHCMEKGGTVLNAAVTLSGKLPIEVTVRKITEHKIVLSSTDVGAYKEYVGSLSELQDCKDPYDAFALHKAALIVCGVLPHGATMLSVANICEKLGGGLYFDTRVINVPKGSGLGTSSILASACVKGLCDLFGISISTNEVYNRVLCMEQLMSTGGGWQDQVGGLMPGIKLVTTNRGMQQMIQSESLALSEETIQELNERFCLIYTGQRRLARNLLREVVGRYIGNDKTSLEVHSQIQCYAREMKKELECGNVNRFAELLSEHWKLSKLLDAGCTNACIDQILSSVEDLTSGQMVCGAGGGGFLQVILKPGVNKETLKQRLNDVFSDRAISVWECRIES